MALSTLKGPVTPIVLPQAQAQAELTIPPSTFHHFMELPVEIRLLIYKELIVQGVDLRHPRCYLCSSLEDLFQSTNLTSAAQPTPPTNLVCTAILMTSKKIHSETLPLLYSKNTVHARCPKCEWKPYVGIWTCPVEPDDLPSERIERYHGHVKSIAIRYAESASEFPDHFKHFAANWPATERQILACYKNIEYIRLNIQLLYPSEFDPEFDLVRRSCEPTIERDPDYHGVLEPQRRWFLEEVGAIDPVLAAFEETCDAIVLSNARGKLKDTVFAVQSIRWNSSYGGDSEETILYLGCEKYTTSDAFVAQIRRKGDS